MVKSITSTAEFQDALRTKGKLVVVDFSATWCGPCKRIEPEYHALASSTPDVLFCTVLESDCQDLIMSLSVRAFPTFRFYIEGQQVDEVQGANMAEVRAKVDEHKAKVRPSFEGAGASLGGGGGEVPLDPRAARLARFGGAAAAGGGGGGGGGGGSGSASSGGTPPPPPDADKAKLNAKLLAADAGEDVSVAPMEVDKDDGAAGVAGAAGGGASAAACCGGQVPKRAIDPSVQSQLEDMGFLTVRAKKALLFGSGGDLESAVNWIMEHQEDADIDDPIPEGVEEAAAAAATAAAAGGGGGGGGGGGEANSLKCDDCGKLLKDVVAAEMHAHKTQHGNFSESVEAIKPLTPEEKAAKIAALKERIASRRATREEEEKVDHVAREKTRRFTGKEMAKTREELEKQDRKRLREAQQREKKASERERERLRAEIAKDKAERRARGGKLAGKLSVDGYAPTGLQAAAGDPTAVAEGGGGGGAAAAANSSSSSAAASVAATPPADPRAAITKAVSVLAKQRVGGEGGVAMKTCAAYVKNALEKGADDDKFRNVNMENKAFKTRVANCVGGVTLLKAAGFEKVTDAEGVPKLSLSMERRDPDLLAFVLEELAKAQEGYVPLMAQA